MTATEHHIVKFEELTDDQKEKVINKNREWNVQDSVYHEFIIEDAKEIGAMMGIDIKNVYFSGFYSQGDGACFTGGFSHVKNIVKNIKEHCGNTDKELIRIAEEISTLFRKSFYTAQGAIGHSGHYYHERSMYIDCDFDQKGSFDEDDWMEVFSDFALWIYKRLEKEYEYLTSDEQVAESLIANEVEFEIDEDGDLVGQF